MTATENSRFSRKAEGHRESARPKLRFRGESRAGALLPSRRCQGVFFPFLAPYITKGASSSSCRRHSLVNAPKHGAKLRPAQQKQRRVSWQRAATLRCPGVPWHSGTSRHHGGTNPGDTGQQVPLTPALPIVHPMHQCTCRKIPPGGRGRTFPPSPRSPAGPERGTGGSDSARGLCGVLQAARSPADGRAAVSGLTIRGSILQQQSRSRA